MKRWLEVATTAGMLCVSASMAGQSAPTVKAQDGLVRIWGHGHRDANGVSRDYIKTLLTAWQDGFRKSHPEVKFEDDLFGNASAMGSLYTGTGELAILDREASFIEVDAYQQGTGYDPFRIPVARGSVSLAHHAPALKVYVNKASPLAKLTLQQLDAIFDADHRLGKQAYKTWGDVGLMGKWADKPIQLYMPYIQSADVQFFERAAMKGSQKFSCCLKLFPGVEAEVQVADAVAKDKYGIGISGAEAAGLKAVAMASREGAEPVQATAESIEAGTYPLARTVYVYVNRKPKTAMSADLKAFLEYVVSAQGQAVVAKTGGYLPLSDADAAKAKEALQ